MLTSYWSVISQPSCCLAESIYPNFQDVITVMDSDNCIALGKKRGLLEMLLFI